jgi:energy-coupling factor transport system permease protein
MVLDTAIAGTSVLHRFDPRPKLLLLCVVAMSFFIPVPTWVTAGYTAALAIIVAATLGLRELWACLAAIARVLILITLLTIAFQRSGDAAVSFFGIVLVTQIGLANAIRLVVRFTGVTLAFFSVFRTLGMDDMILTLRWFGLPFRPAMVLVIAFRFVPTLVGLARNVQDAHALRSAGSIRRRRFRGALQVLTSIVVSTVRQIPSLSMALESRGFGRRTPRTAYRSLPYGPGLALSWVAAVLIAAAFLLPVFLPVRLFSSQ